MPSHILDTLAKIFDVAIKNDENINTVLRYLAKYGYIDATKENDVEQLLRAIAALHKAAGFGGDGTITHDTLHVMTLPRCGCRDVLHDTLGVAGITNKWGKKRFKYCIKSYPGSVAKEEWFASFRQAFDYGEAAADIKFEQTTNPQEADFIIAAGQGPQDQFDGKGGVLAWNELPPTSNFIGQLHGKFDAAETWIPKGKTAGPTGIYVVNVAAHEVVGHGLGLSHTDVPGSLMNPFYSANIAKPQAHDKQELVARYGESKTPSTPPTTPQPPVVPPKPPTDDEITITIKGKISDLQASSGFRIYRG